MRKGENGILASYGVVLLIVFVILALTVNWTDSNLDWLLSSIKGREIDVPTWISAIITFVGNGFVLVFNIICELIKLVK